jgi:hypothetical protein
MRESIVLRKERYLYGMCTQTTPSQQTAKFVAIALISSVDKVCMFFIGTSEPNYQIKLYKKKCYPLDDKSFYARLKVLIDVVTTTQP